MLCSVCGHRDAIVFLKNFNDGKIVYPLCKECYEEVRSTFNKKFDTFSKKLEHFLLNGKEE